jgi:putative RecB family exonuclease
MTLLRITPTRLTTYLDCPRRYHLAYVAKARDDGKPRAHLTLGSSVHLALARWWDLPAEDHAAVALRRRAGVTDVDDRMLGMAHRLLTAAWSHAGYRDEAQSVRWLFRSSAWLAWYLVAVMPLDRPRGVERTVAFVRGDIAYEGRADRIDADDDGLVVVDYKMGHLAPTEQEAAASLALAIYAYGAWATLKARCTRVELHHVPTGEIARVHRDEEWLRRHIGRADELAAEIRLHTDTVSAGGEVDVLFPPKVGPLCASCPYRSRCPEGQGAMPAEEPWAVLDRWDVGELLDTATLSPEARATVPPD